jgi:hypothetical protein
MRFGRLLEESDDGEAGWDRDGGGILAWLKAACYVTQMSVQMLRAGEANVASILRGRVNRVLPGQDREVHSLLQLKEDGIRLFESLREDDADGPIVLLGKQ